MLNSHASISPWNGVCALGWVLGVCLCPSLAIAQNTQGLPHGLRVVLEAEYDTPTHDYRAIQSVFVNAVVGFEWIHPIHLSVYGGITATAAWGYILQYNAAFQNVRYDTTAGGT